MVSLLGIDLGLDSTEECGIMDAHVAGATPFIYLAFNETIRAGVRQLVCGGLCGRGKMMPRKKTLAVKRISVTVTGLTSSTFG